MGATLMSCNSNGKKQNINQVIVLDSISKPKTLGEKEIDTLETSIDSIIKSKKDVATKNSTKISPPPLVTSGLVVMGIPESTNVVKKEELAFDEIDVPPKFKRSATTDVDELKKEFLEKLTLFVTSKIDKNIYSKYITSGKYKTFSKLIIDKSGKVIDIKTKAPHAIIEVNIDSIIQKLPQLIPGTQNNKPVSIEYILPITFLIE